MITLKEIEAYFVREGAKINVYAAIAGADSDKSKSLHYIAWLLDRVHQFLAATAVSPLFDSQISEARQAALNSGEEDKP